MQLEDYVKNRQDLPASDSWADKARREIELLGVGLSAIPDAAADAFTERPVQTAFKLTTAAGLSFALRCATNRGGMMSSLAKSVGVGLGVSAVTDLGHNVGPIAYALSDNLNSADNWDDNAAIMKQHFAPFAVDTTLAVGAGIVGGYGAGRLNRSSTFEPTLPPFTKNGLLPPGIHQATWQEFSARYGTNARRQDLLANMEVLLQQAKQHAGTVEKVYVGGSFVTAKAAPTDFDMTWRLCGTRFMELEKKAPLLVDRSLQKQVLGGQLMATYPNSPGDGVLGFLQVNRRLQVPVGVVEIDFSTLPSYRSYRLRTWLGTAGLRPIVDGTKKTAP